MDKQRQWYSAGFNDIVAGSEPPAFVNGMYIAITGNYFFLICKDDSGISLENQEGVKNLLNGI